MALHDLHVQVLGGLPLLAGAAAVQPPTQAVAGALPLQLHQTKGIRAAEEILKAAGCAGLQKEGAGHPLTDCEVTCSELARLGPSWPEGAGNAARAGTQPNRE